MSEKEIMGVDASILRELKKLFKETDIQEVELEESDLFYLKVSRKKGGSSKSVSTPTFIPVPYQTGRGGSAHYEMPAENTSAPAPAAPQAAPVAGGGDAFDNEDKYFKITSPVIGTYYSSPSPDAKPFVNTGDFVSPDSTVCIVEAMKVMNEIKAEVKGKVVQMLKSNGDSVQAGEALFVVEKV